jgi:DNA-binding transcriptional regulator YiaG
MQTIPDRKRPTTRTWAREAHARKLKRIALDMTQGLVAFRLGVSAATLSRWETGCIRPNDTMVRAWDMELGKEAP